MTPQVPHQSSARPRMTIGELCQAIGEQRIAAKRSDDDYVVRGSDVRRLARGSASARSVPGQRSRRPAC
jgi:hypothetical protein